MACSKGNESAAPSQGPLDVEGAQLSGTFQQACRTSGGYSIIGILSFTGDTEVGTTNVFTGNNCGTMAYSFTLTGKITVGSVTTPPQGGNKLDVKITSATVTPKSQAGADLLNTNNFCGLDNWAVGVAQSIIDRSCDGRTYNVGTVIYTVFAKNADSLLMGQIGLPGSLEDGSSDIHRPTTLGQPFLRQQ